MNDALYENILKEFGEADLRFHLSEVETMTFLGGTPRCSMPLEWPRKDGRPLGFVGQIDLSGLAVAQVAPWLPSAGRLLFFYDMEDFPDGCRPSDMGGWAVIHDVKEGPAQEISFPDDLKETFRCPAKKYLIGKTCMSLPSTERLERAKVDFGEDEDFWQFQDLIEGGHPKHRMGGYPIPMQEDDMEDICQLASGGINCYDWESTKGARAEELRRQINDWKLLFQVDTDMDVDMMWGDAGILCFWIREADAKVGNFSNVWVQVQTG